MRFLVPTLCGLALLAGTVEASAQERRGHMGHHMRGSVVERHAGPSVSVRVTDRGYRRGHYSGSYYGYGPSYGTTSYVYGPAYGYSSYYGPSYGYRSAGYYDNDYAYGYVSTRRVDDDDDCD